MKGFVLSPAAAADLSQLWEFIAQDNIDAADRLREQIYEEIRRLTKMPLKGHLRPDLTARPVRFWPVGPYLIVYRPDRDPLEIVRVLHAARDIEHLL
jgi:antitoxin ParD1/3/4/toxin ParE1/3/4